MEIQLIGDLRISVDGEPLTLPASRKTRPLLAYLILSDVPVTRERLCEIFWQVPDDPRGSLRWSLSKLRSLVDEPDTRRIVADREQVAFDPQGARIDILDLRVQLDSELASLPVHELTGLASLTAMGYLRGLDLTGQPDFDHFIASERELFRGHRQQILEAVTHALEDRPADAVRWLQDLVEVVPYSEQAHSRLIRTLARVGRKADADRQLESSLAVLTEVQGTDLEALKRAARARPEAKQSPDVPPSHSSASSPALQQQIQFCKTGDGIQIAYASVGSGPPLIKTANWMNHLEYDWESPVWRHVFHGLALNRNLVRYDARGNGLSDWDVDDFELERQVSDLEAVVEATGLDRFPLFGLSQGCAVSAEFAARHPDKVSHLILAGGYARGWSTIGDPEVVRQNEAMITLVGMGWGKDNPAFRQMFTSMFMPDAPSENQSWFNELQRLTTTPENAVKLIRANGRVDVSHRLAAVRAPTLVLHARNDMRIPFNSGRELAGGITGARFVTLDSRNHLLPESDPAWPRMLAEIDSFLSS